MAARARAPRSRLARRAGRHGAVRCRAAARVAVIGGSGGTGAECVLQALESGMEVTALVRDAGRLVVPPGSGGERAGQPLEGAGLKVVVGSATNQADVDEALEGASGVVVALGGKTKDVGPTMLTDATACVIDTMKRKGIQRVAVVTSIGVGDSADQAPFVFKILMSTVMRSIFTDKGNQEELFLSGPGKDLEYCIVRPGGLGDGPPTGEINVIDGQAGSIARSDVAAFCLGAVTQKSFEYIGKTPCISSVGGVSWTKDRGDKTMFEA